MAFVSTSGNIEYDSSVSFDKGSSTLSADNVKLPAMKCDNGDGLCNEGSDSSNYMTLISLHGDIGYDASLAFEKGTGTLSAENAKVSSLNGKDAGFGTLPAGTLSAENFKVSSLSGNDTFFAGALSADNVKLPAMEGIGGDMLCEGGSESSNYVAFFSLSGNMDYDSSVACDKSSGTLSADNFKLSAMA